METVLSTVLEGKMETTLDKNKIIAKLAQSPHGALELYIHEGKPVAEKEPEFFAHLIAWNERKGQIRDSKTALPVVALMALGIDPEFEENALAHLGLLSPRDFLRAVTFAHKNKARRQLVKRLVARYLKSKERDWKSYERTLLYHKVSLYRLYTHYKVKPLPMVNKILFEREYPKGSVFQALKDLPTMTPIEAAGAIITKKLPFLMLAPILGEKLREPALLMALIGRMSPTELVTNTRFLFKLGVQSIPAARAAYEEGLKRVGTSQANILKTTKQAQFLEEDNPLREKLMAVQEKQIEKALSIDGDWLILADKSGSMQHAIETSRHIASIMARSVKGKVYLVFFDTIPRLINVTGMTLEKIENVTKHVTAAGGTSIGCGLQMMIENQTPVDGICVVSDMAENSHPQLAAVYDVACRHWNRKPPVYLYQLDGTDAPQHRATFMHNMKLVTEATLFDLRGQTVDYYALPSLVATMRVKRYGLVDEIMNSRLLKLDMVLPLGA